MIDDERKEILEIILAFLLFLFGGLGVAALLIKCIVSLGKWLVIP